MHQRWIWELEVHPRHGKSGLPGISPSMQAVLFERNSWLGSWEHPSLLSGELHIVAICSSMLNNKQADAIFSWSYISVYDRHLHVTPPPYSLFLLSFFIVQKPSPYSIISSDLFHIFYHFLFSICAGLISCCIQQTPVAALVSCFDFCEPFEVRADWKTLSPESSQHSRSQARVKEEGCVRFWQTSIKNATLMDMKPFEVRAQSLLHFATSYYGCSGLLVEQNPTSWGICLSFGPYQPYWFHFFFLCAKTANFTESCILFADCR